VRFLRRRAAASSRGGQFVPQLITMEQSAARLRFLSAARLFGGSELDFCEPFPYRPGNGVIHEIIDRLSLV